MPSEGSSGTVKVMKNKEHGEAEQRTCGDMTLNLTWPLDWVPGEEENMPGGTGEISIKSGFSN